MHIPSPEPLVPSPFSATQRHLPQRTGTAFGSRGGGFPRTTIGESSMPEPSAVPAPVRSYRDWQQAMDLAEATYRAPEQFPEHERYGLVNSCGVRPSRLRRTSRRAMPAPRATISAISSSRMGRSRKWRPSSSSAPAWRFSQRAWRSLCCRHVTRSVVCWAASGRGSEPGECEGLGVRGYGLGTKKGTRDSGFGARICTSRTPSPESRAPRR